MGPSQRLVPAWNLLGARLPRAPAYPLPSCNGKEALLIPRIANPNCRMGHHVAPLLLSRSRPLACTKCWVLTWDPTNSSSVHLLFSPPSQPGPRVFSHTRTAQFYLPIPSTSWDILLQHGVMSSSTHAAGGHHWRGWPVQHSSGLNRTMTSCEACKCPDHSSAMAHGVQTVPLAFWGNNTCKWSYSWALQADEDSENITLSSWRSLLQILGFQLLQQQRQEKMNKQESIFPVLEWEDGFRSLTISRSWKSHCTSEWKRTKGRPGCPAPTAARVGYVTLPPPCCHLPPFYKLWMHDSIKKGQSDPLSVGDPYVSNP